MKAAITTRYGSPEVIQIQEIITPVPGKHEIQVNVRAATLIMGDSEIRRFKIPFLFWLPLRLYMGVFKPRIKVYGQELAGVVTAVGANVTKFTPGERVFFATNLSLGAHAEFRCVSENETIASIPEGLSYECAAAIPVGGSNALHFIRKASVEPGNKVLIIGAGGSIGTFAVQLARMRGAVVTCVDKGSKANMLLSLGADHFIDYEKTPIGKIKEDYDVIIDIVGKASVSSLIQILKEKGRLILGNPGLPSLIQAIWYHHTTGKRVITQLASYKLEDFQYLSQLVKEAQLKVIIDRVIPLERIRDAHEYVDSGNKMGHVVIKISGDQPGKDDLLQLG